MYLPRVSDAGGPLLALRGSDHVLAALQEYADLGDGRTWPHGVLSVRGVM